MCVHLCYTGSGHAPCLLIVLIYDKVVFFYYYFCWVIHLVILRLILVPSFSAPLTFLILYTIH